MIVSKSTAALAVSGALSSALENRSERYYFRTSPYPYPQQVSKVNSLWSLE
jgi:hypothetical protein